MIIETRTEDLLEKTDNRYELAMTIAKRTRQLVDKEKNNPNKKGNECYVSIAAKELNDGDVYIIK